MNSNRWKSTPKRSNENSIGEGGAICDKRMICAAVVRMVSMVNAHISGNYLILNVRIL